MNQPKIVKALAVLLLIFLWVVAIGGVIWAFGALSFDLPWPALRRFAAVGFVLALALGVWRVRGGWKKVAVLFAGFAFVLAWWLTLRPSNDRHWQADVAQTGWAEIDGDTVTLHNLRNCQYRTENDYTTHWETRTVRLSQITGIDMAITYWGSPWIAHPIVSFQFADALPVCFSVETRKQVGQEYSAIGGLYRQFELIYLVSDERDVIRLRTDFRPGEDVYLYRTTTTPAQARERFLEYLHSLNALHTHARWYNAVTANCTTSIRAQHPASERMPWDWRILLNGKGDEMMYERKTIVTAGLPFAELKERAHINAAARRAGDAPDFSRQIRADRPGF